MKDMEQIAATRQIITAYSETRIVTATDYDDLELLKAGAEAGASSYATKEDLLSVLEILKT